MLKNLVKVGLMLKNNLRDLNGRVTNFIIKITFS